MSEKSKSTTFLLCYFLGIFGAHRFYLRRWPTAGLMLLTAGGLGIWWLIDSVLIMGGKFRDAEGKDLRTGAPDPDQPHAGFWVRLAAISVDMIILQLVVMVLVFIGSIGLGVGSLATLDLEDPVAAEQFGTAASGLMAAILVIAVPLYFGLQTASSQQATIGKRVFALYVDSHAGGKLNLPRSLWRAVCYLLSAIPLYLGFVLAAFTKDKRALHDYLAGSRVMYVTQDELAVSAPAAADPAPVPAKAPVETSAVVMRRADRSSSKNSGDTGTRMILVLGALLLAGAAALALL